MAHKKAGGSARNGRDSKNKHLGVKLFGGQVTKAGNALVRQCGTKFHIGYGIGPDRDHTLFAKADGMIKLETKGAFGREYVNIIAAQATAH